MLIDKHKENNLTRKEEKKKKQIKIATVCAVVILGALAIFAMYSAAQKKAAENERIATEIYNFLLGESYSSLEEDDDYYYTHKMFGTVDEFATYWETEEKRTFKFNSDGTVEHIWTYDRVVLAYSEYLRTPPEDRHRRETWSYDSFGVVISGDTIYLQLGGCKYELDVPVSGYVKSIDYYGDQLTRD